MRYGVTMFATDVAIGVVELARAVEERGLDSLWLPEHTHIPIPRTTPHPSGQELADKYKRSLDPLVALAAASTATTTLRLGTGVLLPAQRDPIVTAKAVASLDHVSGGRVAVGVGFGWNEDEMADHGIDYRGRRAVAREHVLAMQALWHDEEAGFDGDFVRFAPSCPPPSTASPAWWPSAGPVEAPARTCRPRRARSGRRASMGIVPDAATASPNWHGDRQAGPRAVARRLPGPERPRAATRGRAAGRLL